MMKHKIGDVETESFEQRTQRVAFEAWMQDNYPAIHFTVQSASGCYEPSEVNACWEIWLHKTRG